MIDKRGIFGGFNRQKLGVYQGRFNIIYVKRDIMDYYQFEKKGILVQKICFYFVMKFLLCLIFLRFEDYFLIYVEGYEFLE